MARRIAALTFPGAQSLDVIGPLEVFAVSDRLGRERGDPPRWSVEVVARERGPVACSSGVAVVASRGFDDPLEPLDTLFVAGGEGTEAAVRDPATLDWLRRAAARARRVASVCSGAFLLAQAGLLRGRRATTHWRVADRLAALHPDVQVEPDRLYTRDGRIWTSAGVTAGLDLALALLQEDAGRDHALAVARHLVLFLQRPGGQSQFSAQLEAQLAERDPVRQAQDFVLEHPEADCAVPALARRVAMSARNFARVFTREVGMTPARFVERVRVEAARRRLEQSDEGLEEIASRCGFGSAETLRRSFLRQLAVGPSDYRARFRGAAPPATVGGPAALPV